jgi:hypothetical protein
MHADLAEQDGLACPGEPGDEHSIASSLALPAQPHNNICTRENACILPSHTIAFMHTRGIKSRTRQHGGQHHEQRHSDDSVHLIGRAKAVMRFPSFSSSRLASHNTAQPANQAHACIDSGLILFATQISIMSRAASARSSFAKMDVESSREAHNLPLEHLNSYDTKLMCQCVDVHQFYLN